VDAFGYTEREARFLYLVATFGGHFFRAQYLRFCNISRAGSPDSALVRKLVDHGHATAYEWDSRKVRFHLTHRRVYRLLGSEHTTNRKQSSNALINVRLAGLDSLLDNIESNFLADEQQRVRFFVDICRVPEPALPQKLFVPRRRAGASTVCYFV